MQDLKTRDPEIAGLTSSESKRVQSTLNLIAAENHPPLNVLEAQGSIFMGKVIEGYPGNRYHSGCQFADEVENLAIERCQQLFKAEAVNVQPHSGTSANLAVYFAVLDIGDKILSMNLQHGGHLSHGHQASITSRCFQFEHYGVNPETELIDYDAMATIAARFQPRMIVAGASSYPRLIDYEKIYHIAKKHKAFFMVDMAHIAGLVASQVIPSPVPFADFVTFTCYKTLIGCRGGVIIAKEKYSKAINRSIFPGCQGTSGVNQIAAKAVTFQNALQPDFKKIQLNTLKNANVLAHELAGKGYHLVSGGTDNHQVLIDLADRSISGQLAETTLEKADILCNRNVTPKDALTPGSVSGIRLGTAALTTRGFKENEFKQVAHLIDTAIRHSHNSSQQKTVKDKVSELCHLFPVYDV
ncbi:MAG: serine hydroxymethyltransferase [Deltaproteobacteria bacterium]|jgi:glycine hydroxymethyltransferase|nr:serine hydroxymethyltransferase [Deltaproteobacteria bacterium]